MNYSELLKSINTGDTFKAKSWQKYSLQHARITELTLIPAMGEMIPQCGFCGKSHSKQWNETAVFCDIVTDPLSFLTQLSISLQLLPVLRGRFGCNVHVTRFCDYQHCTPVMQRYKLRKCDTFWTLNTENGKMTRQEYKERYFVHLQDDGQTGSSNRSSSRAHSRSHRLIQPNKSEVLVLL